MSFIGVLRTLIVLNVVYLCIDLKVLWQFNQANAIGLESFDDSVKGTRDAIILRYKDRILGQVSVKVWNGFGVRRRPVIAKSLFSSYFTL